MSECKINLKPFISCTIKILLWVVLPIAIIVTVGNYIKQTLEFWDDDIDRGATTVGMESPDAMGDHFSKVVYPEQGWSEEQSIWYYNITQGSNLIPYDFFLELEQADSQTKFRDPANMNHYRYLVQKPTHSNPDGLPVGMVKDTYQGRADHPTTYIGFSCSACHTSQVNVNGTAIRIDGGPAAADMVGYLRGMEKALQATLDDPEKKQRFIEAVLERGEYKDATQVLDDLETYSLRVSLYNITNHSTTRYGYARLDAFGRIFNRVLEHLLTKEQLEELVSQIPGLSEAQIKHIMAGTASILTSKGREEIVHRTLAALQENGRTKFGAAKEAIKYLRKPVFNPPNAPVSYPFLWDIAQHDYVQWNGIGDNSAVGPLGRNVGEVIGVFGTLDWHITDKCRLSEKITGQCSLTGDPSQAELVRFESSVDMRNLRKIEQQLSSLMSPRWEDPKLEGVLPALDQEKVAQGEAIFDQYCVACHHDMDSRSPYRKVVAFMNDVDTIGTDPAMAKNALEYKGKSGFIENLYVNAEGNNLVIQDEMPVASLLTYTTTGVVTTPDPDKNPLISGLSWIFDLYKSYSGNAIKDSLRRGDYPLSTTHNPYASLYAYKGRPLNGIWATAPYLHNGSVPTLYDLLLPAECPVADPGCEKRPETFMVGSRELDTEKVGFKYTGYEGFEFLTDRAGNSNRGHEYAAGNTPQPDGTVLPALNREQRLALVEYMKSL